MKTKKVSVDIISKEAYKQRTIAIAKGEYIPKKDEPKIWFESIKSMAQVLSNENQQLLKVIIDNKPQSLSDLVTLTGRAKSKKTLERYGIVSLDRVKNTIIPEVKATDFKVEFSIGQVA